MKLIKSAVLVTLAWCSCTTLIAENIVLTHQWEFATAANPAPAASAGDALARIQTGNMAAGWQQNLPMLQNGRGGFWDLGVEGKIEVTLTPQVIGSTYAKRLFTVRVSQWWDGGIFGGFAAVTVPGAKEVSSNVDIERLSPIGGWVVDELVFEAEAGATLDQMLVQAGKKGAVIDEISVTAQTEAAVAPELAIEFVTGSRDSLRISWPELYQGMELQSTTDASRPDWQKVEAQAGVAEGRCSIITSMDGPARFYRLKQP